MGKIEKNYKKTIWLIAINTILIFLLLVGLCLVISLLPIKGNFKVLTVLSGSMEPTIKTGSIVIVRPISNYKVSDIITFIPQQTRASSEYVTHRIFDKQEVNNQTEFLTKGDANNMVDAESISADHIIGKVIFSIPYVGYILGYIKTLPGLILIIFVPATIIVYEEVKKIRNEAKKILEKRKAKKNLKKASKPLPLKANPKKLSKK